MCTLHYEGISDDINEELHYKSVNMDIIPCMSDDKQMQAMKLVMTLSVNPVIRSRDIKKHMLDTNDTQYNYTMYRIIILCVHYIMKELVMTLMKSCIIRVLIWI